MGMTDEGLNRVKAKVRSIDYTHVISSGIFI